ncbi:MAG: hypothetical protein A2514_15705 [Gammaproteobacteria bacterium RIFOXYD12_FULL_61_37]|nr:MAG: hypothetical protein A2514_15705 [Gammaproteobacteria bacterium RIFOXYD12_FULL_61_37]
MSMLKFFLEKIRNFDSSELRNWITYGLIAYHDPQSEAFRRAERAFEGAELSFGLGGPYSTAVEDLVQLFNNLDDSARERFNHSLAGSIDLLPITDDRKRETLRDLIEIALETKNSYAIEAVTQKLTLPDAEIRRIICLDAVYFLEESHAATDMLRLGRTILEKMDFPHEISAHLLVGLCRLDVNRAAEYAKSIETKLARQLDTLRNYTEQYERFRSDFASAVLSAPSDSEVVAVLLSRPLYAVLLKDKLKIESTEGTEPVPNGRAIVVPDPSLGLVRTWGILLEDMCAKALRYLEFYGKKLHLADTIAEIDRACAG